MKVSQIIAKSRTQTNTSTAQKTNQQMLDDLNIVQDNIFSELGSTQKLYAWTYWNTDTVANQKEYKLPQENVQQNYPQLKRLTKVFVDYGQWFVKARVFNHLQDNLSYSEDNPVVLQADWSVFLYPTPKQAIIWALRVEWTYRPLPLQLTDESEDIKLAPEHHDILLAGLNKMNYEDKQLRNEAQIREVKYINQMNEMKLQWWADTDWPYEVNPTTAINLTNQFLP